MRDESIYGDVIKRPREDVVMKRKRDGARFIREPSQEGITAEGEEQEARQTAKATATKTTPKTAIFLIIYLP